MTFDRIRIIKQLGRAAQSYGSIPDTTVGYYPEIQLDKLIFTGGRNRFQEDLTAEIAQQVVTQCGL